jgi:hypothetical protein
LSIDFLLAQRLFGLLRILSGSAIRAVHKWFVNVPLGQRPVFSLRLRGIATLPLLNPLSLDRQRLDLGVVSQALGFRDWAAHFRRKRRPHGPFREMNISLKIGEFVEEVDIVRLDQKTAVGDVV